ncbi:MAG TPA: hypothetical protein VIJ20_11645 [Solirubrobacteraceae bacterium]
MKLRIPLALAIASGALLAVGCGGGGAKPTSGTGGPSVKNFASSAFKFTNCMRDHGVTNFPDPKVTNTPGHQSVGIAVTPSTTGSPRFKSAQKACAGILPSPSGNGGPSPQEAAAHLKGTLAFATCMRHHQVPTFPDPNSQGDITPAMLSAASLNLHAPAVDAAAKACVSSSDGQITAADVAQAENGGS